MRGEPLENSPYLPSTPYEELPEGAKEQIYKVHGVVVERYGTRFDVEDTSRTMLRLWSERSTRDWEKKCGPIAAWLRIDPDLAWFVDDARVAREGADVAKKIKEEFPNLSHEDLLEKMYSKWYDELVKFAVSKGYVVDPEIESEPQHKL